MQPAVTMRDLRRHTWFVGAMALVIGVILGWVVASLDSADAAVGDNAIVGRQNVSAGRATTFQGQGSGGVLRARNTGANPALDLRVDDGPPMLVDSRAKVRRLNADQVDGRHVHQLIRAAHGETTNAPDANGAAATATITAPRKGILVMGGSIDANGNTEDLYTCRLQIDSVTVPGSIRGSKVDDGGGEHTDNDAENCSTDGAQEVDSGTHTVTLLMADRNSAAFLEASVWVIWVPFDGNGEVPSP